MVLLQKARVYDSRSRYHLKQVDVLIDKGIIVEISNKIGVLKKAKIIQSKQLCISPGWLDIGTYNGEPGYEYREDLESLRNAAANGGYCAIAPFPTGQPTIDSKGQLHFLIAQANGHVVKIHPIAALTKNRDGKENSELMDLQLAGAVAFSDGSRDKLDEAQLLRSMLYLKAIDGLIIYNACSHHVGHLHEGSISVQMGMEGLPSYEEETNISKAVRQSEYASSKLFIHNISTSGGLRAIKASSNRNNIFTSVPFLNLMREDKDLLDFDTNLKVDPPLRSRSDRRALCKAVESGQINTITSNHTPLSIEEKDQPFGLSQLGASTIETVFAALNTFVEGISIDRLIHCLSEGPHEALGLNCPKIEEGKKACITIFDPALEQTISKAGLKSKSKNNPFIGQELKGQIVGMIRGRKIIV